jgi:3-oxoadipate enol-lactonase
MPFAEAQDGARIAYDCLGHGDPILLISGQALNRSMWDGIRPALAKTFQVITFAHRGTGLSDKPEAPPPSTRSFAGDAVAVLDAAGIARAHVYGFSMGGRVAQWLAIDHPDRVGALVLGATSAGGSHAVKRPPDVEAVLRSGRTQDLAATFFSPGYLAANPGAFSPRPIPLFAQRLHFRASEEHDSWEHLPSITAPTLIIHGGEDRLSPAGNAAVLAARIPGAQVETIAGARHGYMDEFRGPALDMVINFLGKHPLP